MSFGGRSKTFARSPQDIATPAATICRGRGKLVTLRLAPCYIPPKSLLGRPFSPFTLRYPDYGRRGDILRTARFPRHYGSSQKA